MSNHYLRNNKGLRKASMYAKFASGCTKVRVGSIIVKDGIIVSMGANRPIPNLCKAQGCLRVQKYGDNSKAHRNPDDCRAIHSEIDAIAHAKVDLSGTTIFVTRYPCESCARAIVSAGITTVVYGRTQEISDMTRQIFEYHDVKVIHCKDFIEEDSML